ncbi:histone-like nucleoid-structuring protein, MvaT/MvaU family [Pseudomonas sp. RT6P73]
MSLINQYRATEQAINELKQKLDTLGNNPSLLTEMEFEEKLRALMGQYGKSLRDIIAILDPQRGRVATEVTSVRRVRTVKTYRHPESGEVIQTKGGNHRLLKAWKQQYGADTVASWLA